MSKSGRYTGADFVRQEMVFSQRDAALQRWRQAVKLSQQREVSFGNVPETSAGSTAWRDGTQERIG